MFNYYVNEEFACKCCGVNGISKDLVILLNRVAHRAGGMVEVTSGYRCEKHNREVNGTEDSSHLKGLAVDVVVVDDHKRYKWLKSAIEVGFKRIGVGKNYMHLDIDPDKSECLVWIY